jgi:haloalkane dehalogenase
MGPHTGIRGGRVRDFCRSLPNQRRITVKGLHHLQDDSPGEMVQALREFVLGLLS